MKRWLLCVGILLAGAALGQSTGSRFGGGSFDDDDDEPASSSSTSSEDPGSSSSGGYGSGPTDFGTGSSFSDSSGSTTTARERPRTAAELEADRKRYEAQRAKQEHWDATHRNAGGVPLTDEEVRAFAPASRLRELMWPHGTIGLTVLLLWVFVPIVAKRLDPNGRAQLMRLSVAFDWTVRKKLQRQLSRLSTTAELRTPEQRQRAVQVLAQTMKEHAAKATHAVWSARGVPWSAAGAEFESSARDLRSRYQHDYSQPWAKDAIGLRAKEREGGGLVVISLLVGRRGYGSKLPANVSEQFLEQALTTLARGDAVQVLEVIWSPAAEQDRMSSAELEVVYPELKALRPRELGRVSCPSCKTVYAAELRRCPSCGDASPAHDATSVLAGPCPYCAAPMPKYETRCDACNAWVAADGRARPAAPPAVP